MMNTALLLSGGIGARLSDEIPKQYMRIKGKMMITYSLETLINSSYIDNICIAAGDEWSKFIIEDCILYNLNNDKIIGFSVPGSTRQLSILNGIENILLHTYGKIEAESIKDSDTILIHDAARPLLTEKQINDCFENLSDKYDGVMPALSMKDTVYISNDGNTVSALLDRKRVFAGQAPELFRLKKYYMANVKLLPKRLADINGSTEPAVIMGLNIAMIEGDENNFKITTMADLERFKTFKTQ